MSENVSSPSVAPSQQAQSLPPSEPIPLKAEPTVIIVTAPPFTNPFDAQFAKFRQRHGSELLSPASKARSSWLISDANQIAEIPGTMDFNPDLVHLSVEDLRLKTRWIRDSLEPRYVHQSVVTTRNGVSFIYSSRLEACFWLFPCFTKLSYHALPEPGTRFIVSFS